MTMAIGFILTIVLFVVGIPIWAALSLGAVFLIVFEIGSPVQNIPVTFFNGIDSFTLMAITFFLLAGAIMAYCGPSQYIFNVVNSFFGKRRGGLAITAVVMCMIYAAITGSSTATLSGVASLAGPEMKKKGYSNEFIGSLLAASCTLGQMIPPSILMILYGVMVQANTGTLFISGVIPGILSGVVLCVMAWYMSPKPNKDEIIENPQYYTWSYRGKSLALGFPALFMPIAVLGSIYAGIVTPTEAGALAAVYSIFISFCYRKLTWKSFKDTLISTLNSNSMIFILVAGALLFANPITFMRLPQQISEVIVGWGLNGVQLMFASAALFVVMGMFLDVIPILYLTMPVLYPALLAVGVDLVQFNVVMILCLQIGQISPPFGVALYVSAGVCDAPVDRVAVGVIKYIIAYVIITAVVILVPAISLWLPYLIM